MLTKIKLKNFKSFKNETVVEFLSTKYALLKETNCLDGINKGGMFVGGNATGKTNAIYGISVLLDMLFSNANIDMPLNFCFFSKDKEMELSYTFKFDSDEIVYDLAFDRKGIVKNEVLKINNEIYLNRIGLDARTELTEKKSYDKADIDEKTLFLKVIYFNTKFAGFPVLKQWFEYMSNSVYFNAERQQLLVGQALSFNVNNKVNLRDYLDTYGEKAINDFFDFFGFNQKIEYKSSHKLTEYVSAEVNFGNKDVYMKRDGIDVWMPIALESMGNKTLLSMLPGLLQVVEKGGMFIVDEFSSAFHNELEELIIRYFMQNSKKAQMFFVSHSTNLMKTTLLRPDQIYSVEFDGSNGTTVKRFSDERPRDSQNLEKMYLSGIFGGLPNYVTDTN